MTREILRDAIGLIVLAGLWYAVAVLAHFAFDPLSTL